MKKLLFASVFAISTAFALPTFAASEQMMSVVPSEMQNNMQQVMQMKSKKIAWKLMFMGMKMYMMGKLMMNQNMDSNSAKMMMSNGIKIYNIGMEMNDSKPMDLSQPMMKMRH